MKLINFIRTNHPNYSFSFLDSNKLILCNSHGTVYARSISPKAKGIISFFDEVKMEIGSANIISISSDNRFFASSNDDGILRVWDTKEKKNLARFKIADNTFIWSIKFASDNQNMIIGCSNGSIYLSSIDGLSRHEFTINPCHSIHSVDLCPLDENIVACACGMGGASLCNPIEKTSKTFYSNLDWSKGLEFVNVVKFLPSGKLVSGDSKGTVRIWDREGNHLQDISIRDPQSKSNSVNAISCLGEDIFVARYRHIFKISISQPSSSPISVAGMDEEVLCISISPDGRLIAFGGYETKIDIYSLEE